MFLDHTQRRTTLGRTPLDEWSARRRDLYLTTHDTHNRQISMPPVGFCDELITRPEESYRLWCVVVCDLETSRICAPYIYDISSLRVNLRSLLHIWRAIMFSYKFDLLSIKSERKIEIWSFTSSGMWCRVAGWVVCDDMQALWSFKISGNHMPNNSALHPRKSWVFINTSVWTSNLAQKWRHKYPFPPVFSFRMLITTYKTACCHIPQHHNLNLYHEFFITWTEGSHHFS